VLRAEYARSVGDEATEVSSLVSAADADPSDARVVSRAAFALSRYLSEHKDEIPATRRGIYLHSVREHMVQLALRDKLNAQGLSRLAWLYLLEGDEKEAERYASKGLAKEKDNRYCWQILDRIRSR
jgi:hypothetical protein